MDGRKAGEVGSNIPLDPPLSNLRVVVRVWKGITNSTKKKLIGSAAIPLEQVQVRLKESVFSLIQFLTH